MRSMAEVHMIVIELLPDFHGFPYTFVCLIDLHLGSSNSMACTIFYRFSQVVIDFLCHRSARRAARLATISYGLQWFLMISLDFE